MEEIHRLEAELEQAIDTHEEQFRYRLEGTKVHFEDVIADVQDTLKQGVFHWLKESDLRNVLSAPIIYSMIIPFVLLDITISLYQLLCFPLYKIPLVRRDTYMIFDRHRLAYLNVIEKVHCLYCGYINGLVSYSKEIVARTEMYWCPLKHASRLVGAHRHYSQFADYGDSDGYSDQSNSSRESLRGMEDE